MDVAHLHPDPSRAGVGHGCDFVCRAARAARFGGRHRTFSPQEFLKILRGTLQGHFVQSNCTALSETALGPLMETSTECDAAMVLPGRSKWNDSDSGFQAVQLPYAEAIRSYEKMNKFSLCWSARSGSSYNTGEAGGKLRGF